MTAEAGPGDSAGELSAADRAAVDALAETYQRRGGQPGTAYGIVAGGPTDDPWGDRQRGTPLPEFSEFLSAGVSFAWAPGTRFEYSNLGYAILGRVISAVSGMPYPDFIRTRLLAPLGMSHTGFEAA